MNDKIEKIRDNLVPIGNGAFVSRDDPRMWEKILQRNNNDKEALFNVSLNLEEEAYYYFDLYTKTKIKRYAKMYEDKIYESVELMYKSFENGNKKAMKEFERIKEKNDIEKDYMIKTKEKKPLLNEDKSNFFDLLNLTKGQFIVLGVVCFIIGMLISMCFFSLFSLNENNIKVTRNPTTVVNSLSYEIIEDKPNINIDTNGVYEIKIIKLDSSLNKEEIENQLESVVNGLYRLDSHTPKKIIAIQDDNKEIGSAIWLGNDEKAKVFIYPNNYNIESNK